MCVLVQRFEPQGRRFTNFHYYCYKKVKKVTMMLMAADNTECSLCCTFSGERVSQHSGPLPADDGQSGQLSHCLCGRGRNLCVRWSLDLRPWWSLFVNVKILFVGPWGPGMSDISLSLESQGCRLIPLSRLLFCFSGKLSCSFLLVFC